MSDQPTWLDPEEEAARIRRMKLLLVRYSAIALDASTRHSGVAVVHGMHERLPKGASILKTTRWLAFAQGALVSHSIMTLQQAKLDSLWVSHAGEPGRGSTLRPEDPR